jgi:hypothetical protein
MRTLTLALALCLSLALLACGKPVPAEKSTYVGEWQEKTTYLLITRDGSVRYQRRKGGATVSVEAPLQAFQGNDFTVGVGPITTTFLVSKPPYREGEQWKMVVDDVTRVKTAQ